MKTDKNETIIENAGKDLGDFSQRFYENRKKQKRIQNVKFLLTLILTNSLVYHWNRPALESSAPPLAFKVEPDHEILEWPAISRVALSPEKKKRSVSLLGSNGKLLISNAYLHFNQEEFDNQEQQPRSIEIKKQDLPKLLESGTPFVVIVPPVSIPPKKPRKTYEIVF